MSRLYGCEAAWVMLRWFLNADDECEPDNWVPTEGSALFICLFNSSFSLEISIVKLSDWTNPRRRGDDLENLERLARVVEKKKKTSV